MAIAIIKRIRVVRRADGYYVQFSIKIDPSATLRVNTERSRGVDVRDEIEPSKQVIGLDVGLEYFYTDSNGNQEEKRCDPARVSRARERAPRDPRFYRKNEKKRSRLNRRFSRTKKGSNNRAKARIRLAKLDLKTSRQREEHAKRLARCVVHSNDVIVYENLPIRNLVKNHKLAKSISDAGWYQFRKWLEYFGKKFGKVTLSVEPHFTSQECSSCGKIVKKSLSTRTHKCSCGCELQRDHNAALNILKKRCDPAPSHGETSAVLGSPQVEQLANPKGARERAPREGLGTVGHIGTLLCEQNASGETASLLADFSPPGSLELNSSACLVAHSAPSVKADSLKEESS